MEPIKSVLESYQQNIPVQKNFTKSEEAEPEKETIESKLRRFNISSLEHTFEKFKISGDTKQAVVVLKKLSSGELGKSFVMLYGITGCGKTFLIEATIIAWAKRGIFTRYMTFSEMARSLKSALHVSGEKYDALFNTYCETHRLIIDDIGMGTTESRFEISDLEDIIDTRYRRRFYPDSKLVTIIATNKDIKALPDRITSRFFDPDCGVVLYMGDKDYRRRRL